MKNISIWKDTVKEEEYPTLKENKQVDVLIIGGGITGASTYYFLKDSNFKIMLVEQNKISYSTTANSTGKLCYLQNDLIDKIRTNFNDKVATTYLESQIEAINMIIDIINREHIDCDLEKVCSNLYTNKKEEINKLQDLKKFLEKNNIKVKETTNKLVESKYMIEVDDTYLFHPVKFVYGLLSGLDQIYENTSIKRIEKDGDHYICYTNNNIIKTKYIIIASHYPYFNLPFFFPIKSSLEKSYLSASKYNGNKVSLISYSNNFISIRNYKRYLIYLSNSHIINKDTNDKQNFDELLKKTNDINLKPEYMWSNIDIMTNDSLPYIGVLKDNILIGTGYNTWGLTNGVLAGKILSDILTNQENKYINIFNPKRVNINTFTSMIGNSMNSLEGYIRGYLNEQEFITYKKVKDYEIMVYKNKYAVHRKCPHMGCDLIFNRVEKTWDCPCHGSRFDLKGNCICSPANQNITFKDK